MQMGIECPGLMLCLCMGICLATKVHLFQHEGQTGSAWVSMKCTVNHVVWEKCSVEPAIS